MTGEDPAHSNGRSDPSGGYERLLRPDITYDAPCDAYDDRRLHCATADARDKGSVGKRPSRGSSPPSSAIQWPRCDLHSHPVEGGSCNDYDYVCGDPVNGRDLTGLRGTKPLPDLDGECLGGNEDQLRTDRCRGYQQAKVTGDSDFYYKSKTFNDPGKPNAFLQSAGDALSPTLVHGKYLPPLSGTYGCLKNAQAFASGGAYAGAIVGDFIVPGPGAVVGAGAGAILAVGANCAISYASPPSP